MEADVMSDTIKFLFPGLSTPEDAAEEGTQTVRHS